MISLWLFLALLVLPFLFRLSTLIILEINNREKTTSGSEVSTFKAPLSSNKRTLLYIGIGIYLVSLAVSGMWMLLEFTNDIGGFGQGLIVSAIVLTILSVPLFWWLHTRTLSIIKRLPPPELDKWGFVSAASLNRVFDESQKANAKLLTVLIYIFAISPFLLLVVLMILLIIEYVK